MTSQLIDLQISCQDASYGVNGDCCLEHNGCQTWTITHNVENITVIDIELIDILQPGGHIRIDKFVLDGQSVHHWDRFGVYRTNDGKTKKTYGWMDEPGVYRFKIRYSQNLHCFVMYLLDLGQ